MEKQTLSRCLPLSRTLFYGEGISGQSITYVLSPECRSSLKVARADQFFLTILPKRIGPAVEFCTPPRLFSEWKTTHKELGTRDTFNKINNKEYFNLQIQSKQNNIE